MLFHGQGQGQFVVYYVLVSWLNRHQDILKAPRLPRGFLLRHPDMFDSPGIIVNGRIDMELFNLKQQKVEGQEHEELLSQSFAKK